MSKKKIIEIIFCLLFLVPTFWLNIKDNTDWGDDFAMYLKEAKLIVEHKDINSHHYINNPNSGTYSPSAYPIGFPLLLAPVVKYVGLDIRILFYYETIFYVLLGVFLFILLRKHFSFIASFMATLLVCYNPYMLNAKAEILSDIPFTAFLYFSIIGFNFFENKEYFKIKIIDIIVLVIFSLGLAFLMHIRSAGGIFFLSFGLYFLLSLNKDKIKKIHQNQVLYFFILAIFFYLIIKFIYPIKASYNSFITYNLIYENLIIHFTYYIEVLFGFFRYFDVKSYGFITMMSTCFFIVSLFIGLIVELKKKAFGLYLILFSSYFIVICMSNLSNNGFRLILPLIFFFIYYSLVGLKSILSIITSYQKIVAVIMSIIMLFLYRIDVLKMVKPSKNYSSPSDEIYKPVFNYLNENCSESDTMASAYPRAMALFSNSSYFHTSEGITPEKLITEMKSFHSKYYVTFHGATEESILNYIKSDTLQFEKKIEGGEMALYELKQ